MTKVSIRLNAPKVREFELELDVVQAGPGVLVISPKQRLVKALDMAPAAGATSPEFDLLLDGQWFLRCSITGHGASATVDYMSVE